MAECKLHESSTMKNEEDIGEEKMDEDEDGWEECEEEEESPDVVCLFCEHNFPGVEQTFQHCKQSHDFDICVVHHLFQLDCFSYIKMINFIRKEHLTTWCGREYSSLGVGVPWASDDYMRPEIEDDPLLQFDIEELEEIPGDGTVPHPQINGISASTVCMAEHHELVVRLKEAESRAEEAEGRMKEVLTDLEKLRAAAQNLVLSSPVQPVPSHEAIQNITAEEDDPYFASYDHFHIHTEMLQDKVRTESYQKAICNNQDVFRDKVVLDIGCGTGILSMFAASAGARKVIAVDQSDIIYQAMDIVRENNLQDTITLIKGKMEDVDLPVDKVDIIISEWMGYFLLFESMLDTVIWARDRYLDSGGLVLPNSCTLSIAALADAELYSKNLGYWSDVYGFRMTCMRAAVVQEACVQVVDQDKIVSESCVVKEIDISTCSLKDLEFSSPFKLPVSKAGEVTALVGYFDIGFDQCPDKVWFSTGPGSTPTHWKQSVFLMETPFKVSKGEVMEGHLICRKNRKDPRSLKITITLAGKTSTYLMQ